MRVRLPDADDTVWREHATVLASVGRIAEAITAYETASRLAPEPVANDQSAIDRLRAQLN